MTCEKVMSADNQQGRSNQCLTPWYVAGFVDGEGSFHVALYKDVRMKTGWKVIPEFHVSQRVSSRRVLDELVNFFQCGYVKPNHKRNPSDLTYVYVVRNREDLLRKIIPFFERHQLQTEKCNDFRLFATVVRLMEEKSHQTKKGLRKIFKTAYQMNGGGRYRRRKNMI